MKLDLKDVTLCTVGSANMRLAGRALRICKEHADFGDALLLSDAAVRGPFRSIVIDRLASTADYATFVYKHLIDLIRTPYVLMVQWDGYVVDPAAWDPEFRAYDYIGARWPGVTDGRSVGNDGFSFVSRKFFAAISTSEFVLDSLVAGDWLICRVYRPKLEAEFDVRFAPEAVADRFSYENMLPLQPTFGFHGMGNMWRHVDDTEFVGMLDQMDSYVFQTKHCLFLLHAYSALKRPVAQLALYRKVKANAADGDVLRIMRTGLEDEAAAEACVASCEEIERLAELDLR